MGSTYFLETDCCQQPKHRQRVAGDVFLSKRTDEGCRIVSVLADGLGSGIEANVLASLTATMGLEYVLGKIDTYRAAEIMMDALPICRQRLISYSTFTLVDTSTDGRTRIIEHGNPAFVLIRDGHCLAIPHEVIAHSRWHDRRLTCSQFTTRQGDRLVIYSDGISQSGMGVRTPFGWGDTQVNAFLETLIQQNPAISARQLSTELVAQAMRNDGDQAGDDITCGVIYFRHPRHLRILTGPPLDRAQDRDFAQLLLNYPGGKVISGGTTANIVARELKRELIMDMSRFDPEVPNTSRMGGMDLVTEGCLTLSKVAELLQSGEQSPHENGATKLLQLMLQHDVVEFIMGTRINEAYQNPNLPVELDIRRNVIKKIVRLLESKYLKQTKLSYF